MAQTGPLGGSSVGAALVETPVAPTVIHLTGELDLATADDIGLLLQVGTADVQQRLVLDLTGVTFLDCSGLRPLLEARNRVGDRLWLHRPSRAVTRLLDLTQLGATFQLTDAGDPAGGSAEGE